MSADALFASAHAASACRQRTPPVHFRWLVLGAAESVVCCARSMLWELAGEELVQVAAVLVTAMAGHPDRAVRAGAAMVLSKVPPAELKLHATALVRAMHEDPDSAVRDHAVGALGMLEPDDRRSASKVAVVNLNKA